MKCRSSPSFRLSLANFEQTGRPPIYRVVWIPGKVSRKYPLCYSFVNRPEPRAGNSIGENLLAVERGERNGSSVQWWSINSFSIPVEIFICTLCSSLTRCRLVGSIVYFENIRRKTLCS